MSPATIFQIHLALGYVHAVPPDLDVHLIVDNYSTQKHPKARIQRQRRSFCAEVRENRVNQSGSVALSPEGMREPRTSRH
jgi:hypothetical protein